MKQYRKKPVVIEAMQYIKKNREELIKWCGAQSTSIDEDGSVYDLLNLRINTLEGTMRISPKDYVIKGVKGEFYPCKPDIFKATYEEVV